MTSKTSSKRKAAIEALILLAALSLVIAHTAYWKANGRLAALFGQRDVWTVVYNLGLVLITGALLALLMTRATRLMGYEVTAIEHFDDAEEAAENGVES